MEVSFRKSEGVITLKQEKALKPDILKKAVEDAGFTPEWVDLQAVGNVIEQNGQWIFQVDGVDQSFVLLENESLEQLKKNEPLADKTITLSGRVQDENAPELVLAMKEFVVE